MKTRSLMCCYVLTNVPECLEVSRFHCCLDLALVPPTTIRNPILHQSNIKMKYFTIVSLNGAYRRGGMSSSWGSCWSAGWWRPCPVGRWWPTAAAASWPAQKTLSSLSLSASLLRSCIYPSFRELENKWFLQSPLNTFTQTHVAR